MNINRRGGRAKGRKRFCHNDLSDLITNVKTAARKPAPFSDSTHFNPSPRQHWHFLHQLTLKQAAEHLRRVIQDWAVWSLRLLHQLVRFYKMCPKLASA